MITQSDLKSVAHYDETVGLFTRTTSAGGFHIGTVMGKTDSYGYRQLTIKGCSYLAHRAAWLYVYGVWPSDEIDHIDGNRSNNAIANLRIVARKGNNQNIKRSRITNAIGVLGVSKSGRRFTARINANGEQLHLGTFDTTEDAHDAYVTAKRSLHESNTL
jgi:hypothetical protein